jgi:hypothetical protein
MLPEVDPGCGAFHHKDNGNEFDYRMIHEKSMQRLAIISHISETITLGNNSHAVRLKTLIEIGALMNANIGSIYMRS